MAEGSGAPTPDRHPMFAVELREAAGAAEIAIVRIERAGGGESWSDVWEHRFASAEAARVVAAGMLSRPARWPVWAGMAGLLGRDFLTGVIEIEMGHPPPDASIDRRRAGGALPRPSLGERVTIHPVPHDLPPRIRCVVGDRLFLILFFERVVEAERMWDWMRWHGWAYRSWYEVHERMGPAVLIDLLMDLMASEERRAAASGIVVDAERPLRRWRPGE